jgi:hypothetical protein
LEEAVFLNDFFAKKSFKKTASAAPARLSSRWREGAFLKKINLMIYKSLIFIQIQNVFFLF